jgi:carboxylesterase type B
VAITQHLLSKQPPFHRAFATGGTFLTRPPLPAVVHEANYKQICTALNLDSLSPSDRINTLLTMPLDNLIARTPPNIQPNAIIDNDIISSSPSFASTSDPSDTTIPGRTKLKSLAVGSSSHDASVLYWLMSFLRPLAPEVPVSTRASLANHPDAATSLLQLYDLAPGQDEETAFLNLLDFTSDALFSLPVLAFAKGFSPHIPTYAFAFNEPNPWPGQFQGKATHVLDVVFLFQNYGQDLPPAQAEAAREMGLDFARFVSGKEPWERFGKGKRMMKVYGPSSVEKGVAGAKAVSAVVEDAMAPDELLLPRRKQIVEIAEKVGWDAVAMVFMDFLLGTHL